LGTGPDATPYPAAAAGEGGLHQTNVGWASTFRQLFNVAEGKWSRHKGHAGLLRHASTRVTLDTYTQAVTPAKRAAQTAVVTQFFPREDRLGAAGLN